MGKYFGWYRGQPHDVRYKKTEDGYTIFIGDVKIGEVVTETFEKSWRAIPNPFEVKFPLVIVNGFSNRKNAVMFLMDVFHKHRKDIDVVKDNVTVIRDASLVTALMLHDKVDKELAKEVNSKLWKMIHKYT